MTKAPFLQLENKFWGNSCLTEVDKMIKICFNIEKENISVVQSHFMRAEDPPFWGESNLIRGRPLLPARQLTP
ncbi:hypothetical protein DFR78_11117 [Halanaerobium sp. MA284_MarDTE_T2]|nr:hypothetical protein DFR78_11117 [Halanaerobium sp. MA284_MarDTE_T2]RCW81779.1 hypothetical protein DER71_1226 [Halanaerobium sp. DL-01]